MLSESVLRVRNLTKHFARRSFLGRGEDSTVKAVDGVSFSVGAGEAFVIAGESGSGKSTIARLILGLAAADSGEVFFQGREVGGDPGGLELIRSQCQMVYQDPYDSINPRMRVGDVVAEPLEAHGSGTRSENRDRVAEVLGDVRLEPAADMIRKYPHMLSGGQRQRVVLARALALGPRVIIADEPVSMLDVSVRAEILELMDGLRRRYGISFVYITHDLATARFFGTRIAILYRGRVVEAGGVDEVLLDPRHPYTQALVDALPDPDPANRLRRRAVRIRDPPGGPRGGCGFRERCPYAVRECAAEPPLARAGGGREVACFVDIGRPGVQK